MKLVPSRKKTAWILTGDGVNCENETAFALAQAGFRTRVWHINDLIQARLSTAELSERCSLFALPGGFSFGDELGSGKVLALKIKHALRWDLSEYARRGGLCLGVCNGFQALIKLGVFGSDVSITHNAHGQFYNGWVETRVQTATPSVWLKDIHTMRLPIRHGEGRLVFTEALPTQSEICLRYAGDPNGSAEKTAGLTDSTGRILGLMPHPEAFIRASASPNWTRTALADSDPMEKSGDGLKLFENAFRSASEVNR